MLIMLRKKSNIYSELSKKYGLPQPVIEVICNSPFKFAKERIADNDDWRTILFANLFSFKIKKKYKNEQSFDKFQKNELGNTTRDV